MEQFTKELIADTVRTKIIDRLKALRDPEKIGKPFDNWKVTMPTHGVYADVALGICSGAEDYYEVQRQFDLEIKKLEIEKLKLEAEKLRLKNTLIEGGRA
jgi:hypothetical protein